LEHERKQKIRENSILVTVPHINTKMHLFVLFRVLGIESDKEIVDFVLQDIRESTEMFNFIRPSVVEGNKIYSQPEALDELAIYTQYKSKENVLYILYDNLFPGTVEVLKIITSLRMERTWRSMRFQQMHQGSL